MTTTEMVLTGTAASSLGGLLIWIRQDGLIRTATAFVAIFHSDAVRRRDARRVLSDAYLHCRAPEPPLGPAGSRRLPTLPRGHRARRGDPTAAADPEVAT